MQSLIKGVTICMLFAVCALQAFSQTTIKVNRLDGIDNTVFMYRDTTNNIDGRGSMNAPMFMIYPDKQLNEEQANSLINELGIGELVLKYAGSVGIINPVGATYDNEADLEAYKSFINLTRNISNLKIIGIGNGATFVNDVISYNAGEVAGIFVYGGKFTKRNESTIPVPAYIGGGDKTVSAHYVKANGAREIEKNNNYIVYANDNEPLQRVVLSLDKKVTLKEAFDDAWENLLSKNYRFSNYKHTSYTGAQFGQYGNYELEPYLMLEELGVTRKTVKKPLSNQRMAGVGRNYFWYEFIPESVVDAPKGSVPLVVLLHGNNNDNRTQSETSGFIEVAAKEHFIVAEIEWQGAGRFPSDMPLGIDGIEAVINDVLASYPQIDPSRIYAQGLSAGSMTSVELGIRKSHLFAAVAGHSGGLFERNMNNFSGEVKQKSGYVEMPIYLVTGTADDVVPFPKTAPYTNNSFINALNTYAKMNNMPEIEIDFNAEPVIGMKLQDRETVITNKHLTLETGKLYKNGVPLIQFTAIVDYGHWNYRPAAQMMWDFFKQFSRDPQTKKLIYNRQSL